MTTSKRERAKSSTDDIEAAFARSFLEKGYSATSVEAVARELGIPKGSVFYHIGTKEAVFFRVQMEGMREFTDALNKITHADAPPELRLREAIRDSLRRVDPSAGPLFMLSRDSHFLEPEHERELADVRREYQVLFLRIVEDGITTGVFRRPRHLKVVAFGLFRFIGLVRDWYRPDGELTLEEIADAYWEFICRGLGYEPAEQPAGQRDTSPPTSGSKHED